MNPTYIYIYIYICVCVCVCVCVLKRQIDGCGGSESGGETLILIMNQIFYSKKKKKL